MVINLALYVYPDLPIAVAWEYIIILSIHISIHWIGLPDSSQQDQPLNWIRLRHSDQT